MGGTRGRFRAVAIAADYATPPTVSGDTVFHCEHVPGLVSFLDAEDALRFDAVRAKCVQLQDYLFPDRAALTRWVLDPNGSAGVEDLRTVPNLETD